MKWTRSNDHESIFWNCVYMLSGAFILGVWFAMMLDLWPR